MTGLESEPAATARVRRGRLALACGSLLTTVVVAAGAVGLLPVPKSEVAVADAAAPDAAAAAGDPAVGTSDAAAEDGAWLGASVQSALTPKAGAVTEGSSDAATVSTDTPPTRSGRGERVVFDETTQHVWLVDSGGAVLRSYPVSGSVTDNLQPGSYEVYSRSRHATSFDLASTMEYMVRFTQGDSAAIGFHSIPVDPQGRPLQGLEDLGTPQSHGCIRQQRRDAIALWRFADVGTTVVVV